jgi:hypothetical protein
MKGRSVRVARSHAEAQGELEDSKMKKESLCLGITLVLVSMWGGLVFTKEQSFPLARTNNSGRGWPIRSMPGCGSVG